MGKKIQEILSGAEDSLDRCRRGLELAKNHPESKIDGLTDAIVYGRSVISVLQHLKRKAHGFDNWFNKYKSKNETDDLLKFLIDTRNDIIHEGKISLNTHLKAKEGGFNLPRDSGEYGQPPEGAESVFLGQGGTGWNVKGDDGIQEKHYVTPPKQLDVSISFPNPPKMHLGKSIEGMSPEELTGLFYDYLREMVSSAKQNFTPHTKRQ